MKKKNQDSISLMKWSSSQLLKTFCWIATGTPTLIESISVLQLMYKMYFKGNTLSYDAIYIKHEIDELFTHHSPRCTCIRVWINSTLSSLFCTEEEVRNKFSPPAKIFFSAVTVLTLFPFQDFNIIAGKNYISKMLLHIYVKTKYI